MPSKPQLQSYLAYPIFAVVPHSAPSILAFFCATGDASAYNSATRPAVSLNVALPAVSPASYPGGAQQLLADFKQLLAARAGLDSSEGVWVWELRPDPATGGTTIVAQVGARRPTAHVHACYRMLLSSLHPRLVSIFK